MNSFKEHLTEAPRIKRVTRIRNGKVQRNVRTSNVQGYTLRSGKLVRMSSTERMHRKRGARKGKLKRRAKAARIKMKMMRTLRKRKQLGL